MLRTAGIFVAAATTAAFLTIGHFAAETLISAQQARQLHELGNTSLRRAEAIARYGIETLDHVARDQVVSCDPTAQQAMRLYIYQHAAVKDIRVLAHDGAIRCSAYQETLEFDKLWPSRDDMLATSDTRIRLFRVEQFSGSTLGVMRDIDATTSVAAIVGLGSTSFDIMPGELRDHSSVAALLSDGREIARAGDGSLADDATPTTTATTSSEDLPLATQIVVARAALAGFHREPYLPILAAAALLGIAFGYLLARIAGRPDDPLAELDAAIRAREFRPYFQPLFELATQRIVGCEALARWVRADGTVLPPSRFIPLAENSGRIEAITWAILAQALAALQPVFRADPGFKLSVNVVPDHVLHADFAPTLRQIVQRAGVSPHQVVLEITERQQVEHPERAAAAIAALRQDGFRFALDDVGVGHSGLSSLQALGASIIKIDKFFVDSICRDGTAAAIVQMLVRLARELRMSVVAEGIESADQANALAACGVQEGQGYLVSPPLPAERFLALLAAARDVAGTSPLPKVA